MKNSITYQNKDKVKCIDKLKEQEVEIWQKKKIAASSGIQHSVRL